MCVCKSAQCGAGVQAAVSQRDDRYKTARMRKACVKSERRKASRAQPFLLLPARVMGKQEGAKHKDRQSHVKVSHACYEFLRMAYVSFCCHVVASLKEPKRSPGHACQPVPGPRWHIYAYAMPMPMSVLQREEEEMGGHHHTVHESIHGLAQVRER